MLKNYVIIKHTADSGKYLFRVPQKISLKAGDMVLANTKRGANQLGICCCDSFFAEPETVMPLFGTCEKNMAFVTGRVEYDLFTEAMEDEHDEDGEQGEDG